MARNGVRGPGHERRRDNQQWMLDWMVKTTGRVQNFAYDYRTVPREVKSYRMIPRVPMSGRRSQASSTLSRFISGSPMPMKTA